MLRDNQMFVRLLFYEKIAGADYRLDNMFTIA